jgi:FkbM family methyltransferase
MKIVQIGAGRGNDHVTKLIEIIDVKNLILVEANPLNIESLKKCYEKYNCIIENCVITNNENYTEELFYSINDGPGYEVSSIKKNHLKKHGYKDYSIQSFIVKSMTLDSLFEKYKINKLDYLFMDIEGMDAEISLNFNPSNYDIKNIQIETLHLGDKLDSVIEHYVKNGYTLNQGIDLYGYDKMFKKQ